MRLKLALLMLQGTTVILDVGSLALRRAKKKSQVAGFELPSLSIHVQVTNLNFVGGKMKQQLVSTKAVAYSAKAKPDELKAKSYGRKRKGCFLKVMCDSLKCKCDAVKSQDCPLEYKSDETLSLNTKCNRHTPDSIGINIWQG